MVVIRTFQGLHPVGSKAKEIACFPYDVAGEDEARAFVSANPNSFLRVTRPEAQFHESVDPLSDGVLAAARANLEDLIAGGYLVRDNAPTFYVYRLETETHSQTGVVACCSLAEYESGVIKKHERTRPDKVADRTTHMVALRAQTGLILLAFRGTQAVKEAIEETARNEPLIDFECAGKIRHSVWKVNEPDRLTEAFADVPTLYIADGHHRIEAALNAHDMLRSKNGTEAGNERYDLVLAGIFPAEELRILPYNRVVRNLGGLSDEEFLARIEDNFVLSAAESHQPSQRGSFGMYFRGKWFDLRFNVEYVQQPNAVERLDVTILQKYLLEPVLGIVDPRTDDRIGFVGGIRGAEELERMVDSGDAVAAFSLHATRMEDLFEISDMGEIMPPKSTWFEPKLKDGLFVHTI